MATYNKFDSFVAALANKVHNLGSDAITIALSNTAPVASNTQLSNITQIAYTNLSARVVTITSSTQTSGTYSLVPVDKVLTASGGAVATFRYVVIYNDTATNDELICWFDYGTGGVTLADGETFTVDFGSSLFTLS